jgi:hypothetical protein
MPHQLPRVFIACPERLACHLMSVLTPARVVPRIAATFHLHPRIQFPCLVSVFTQFPSSIPSPVRSFSSMPPKKQEKSETNGVVGSHRYQAGDTTHRKEDEWKHREPYLIHDENENFSVKWKGKCHCGKVEYQLRREKPLSSKYCHCTTCQRLHGVSSSAFLCGRTDLIAGSLPTCRNFPQIRYQFLHRSP